MSAERAAFAELRVADLIEKSAGPVLSMSLVAFIFLAVRQRRLSERLDALEASGACGAQGG